jgi:hypothetical protein
MDLREKLNWKPKYTITRYASDEDFRAGKPYEVSEFEGNLLLNEGIQTMWDLIIASGTPAAYSNANARIGVGDSSAAEAATQTGLQASTNKTYKAMESGYPSRTNQTVTFRSVFGADDANYAWAEFTIDNGSTPDKNLNRKVSDQGTKASGQTWTVDIAVTLS